MTVIVSLLNSECCEGNFLDRINSRALTSMLIFFFPLIYLWHNLYKPEIRDNDYFICNISKPQFKKSVLCTEFVSGGRENHRLWQMSRKGILLVPNTKPVLLIAQSLTLGVGVFCLCLLLLLFLNCNLYCAVSVSEKKSWDMENSIPFVVSHIICFC